MLKRCWYVQRVATGYQYLIMLTGIFSTIHPQSISHLKVLIGTLLSLICVGSSHADWLEMFEWPAVSFEHFRMCVWKRWSTLHIEAHHRHSSGLMEVMENDVKHFSLCCLLIQLLYSFLFISWSCLSNSSIPAFHQSQSLEQVALTNATVLDGSGGGPNGSLAGSMGSVAVCLPSESSLTDSLHTSAVSQQRDRQPM